MDPSICDRRQFVDQAVANIGDRTLTAELKRQRWLAAQIEEAGREREWLERRVFQFVTIGLLVRYDRNL